MSTGKQEVFTPAEASFYLANLGVRLSPETLRRYVDSGAVEALRTPSGRRLITREALDRLAAARSQEAVA